jgi:hypothetical protein
MPPRPKASVNVVAHLRSSTDEQMQSGLGLDAALTFEGIPTPTGRDGSNRAASAAISPAPPWTPPNPPLSASEVA